MARLAFLFTCYKTGVANKCEMRKKSEVHGLRELVPAVRRIHDEGPCNLSSGLNLVHIGYTSLARLYALFSDLLSICVKISQMLSLKQKTKMRKCSNCAYLSLDSLQSCNHMCACLSVRNLHSPLPFIPSSAQFSLSVSAVICRMITVSPLL